MRRYIISEEQYRRLTKQLTEQDDNISVLCKDPKDAQNVADNVKSKVGGNTDGITIQTPVVGEGRLVKLGELQENRLKALKRNSEVYTVKDFMKNISK